MKSNAHKPIGGFASNRVIVEEQTLASARSFDTFYGVFNQSRNVDWMIGGGADIFLFLAVGVVQGDFERAELNNGGVWNVMLVRRDYIRSAECILVEPENPRIK